MICKYCGSRLNGVHCSSCGKDAILENCSTELEKLMKSVVKIIPPNPTPINKEPSIYTPTSDPTKKTYEQGVKEGLQRGLKDGYENGYKEGINKSQPQPKYAKRIIILCCMALIFGAVVSGFLASKISFDNGYKKGETIGEKAGFNKALSETQEENKQKLSLSYEEGFNAGLIQGQQDGYQIGYDAAINEMVTSNQTIEEQEDKENKEDAIANTSLDFPYSRKRNEKEYNKTVEAIQQKLLDLGYQEIEKADGYYGRRTEKAVKRFQKENGLIENGFVDEEMYNLLFSITNKENPSSELLTTTSDSPSTVHASLTVENQEEDISPNDEDESVSPRDIPTDTTDSNIEDQETPSLTKETEPTLPPTKNPELNTRKDTTFEVLEEGVESLYTIS